MRQWDRSAYVVPWEVVDIGLWQHGVVLELTLSERRGVASNDDELGLSRSEGLEGRLVSQGDCEVSMSVNCTCENNFCIPGITYLYQTSSQAPGASWWSRQSSSLSLLVPSLRFMIFKALRTVILVEYRKLWKWRIQTLKFRIDLCGISRDHKRG